MSGDLDDPAFEQAIENTKPIAELGSTLADAAFESVARECGRTVERQIERMGDRFAYERVEQDPEQKQIDDYEIRGETVEVPA